MSAQAIKMLLVVEDNRGDAHLLQTMFNEENPHQATITHVERMADAVSHLAANSVDIILLDLGLPDAQGLESLRLVHAAAPHIPLVVLTGTDSEALASQALQEGAQDYLIKGQIDARGLQRALRHAVERKVMEEALYVEKERAQVTLNCIGDAVACMDALGMITFLNVVAERLTGWSLQDAIGRPMSEVVRIIDATSGDTLTLRTKLDFSKDGGPAAPSNGTLLRRDGFQIPIEDTVAPIHDRSGEATGAVTIFRDVRAARTSAQQMMHSAQHDVMTGLPNRALLNERLGAAIAAAERHKKAVAVLFLDLDGFKRINDLEGHSAGDMVLRSVAKRLLGSVRGSDTVCRYGGDEFVILLSEIDRPDGVATTAERMLRALELPHRIGEREQPLSASIGVSCYPTDGLDSDTLIANADTAMYHAKQKGGLRYLFFAPAMKSRAASTKGASHLPIRSSELMSQ